MEYKTVREFWPYYLSEHLHPVNRTLHFIGSWVALGFLGLALWNLEPWFLLGALVSGYTLAWIGHFFLEKNRPATFQYPWKSFLSDWVMFYYILTGQIKKEIANLPESDRLKGRPVGS